MNITRLEELFEDGVIPEDTTHTVTRIWRYTRFYHNCLLAVRWGIEIDRKYTRTVMPDCVKRYDEWYEERYDPVWDTVNPYDGYDAVNHNHDHLHPSYREHRIRVDHKWNGKLPMKKLGFKNF